MAPEDFGAQEEFDDTEQTAPPETDGGEDTGDEGGGEPEVPAGPQLRIRQRRTRRELEEVVSQMEARERENSALLREIHEAAQAARPSAEPDLDQLYQENPRAWYEQKLAAEMAEVKAWIAEQREREQMTAQERQEQDRQREVVEQVTHEIRSAVDEYEQTDYGRGFSDRMTYWYERIARAHQLTGATPQQAHAATSAEIAAVKRLGMRYENEYLFMDQFFTEKMGLPPQEPATNGNGHATPAAPRRPAADTGRAAAARSGLAGSIGQPGPTGPARSAGLGDAPSVEDIRAAIAQSGTRGRQAIWDVIARRAPKTR